MNWAKRIAVIIGNFGINFITPLAGLSIFSPSINLEHEIIIALWVAGFGAFLSMFRELADWGATENERKSRS